MFFEWFVYPIFGFTIGIAILLILSVAKWLLGIILYQFNFSKFAGFRMMCESGLFPKLLPQLCPCKVCSSPSCRMWTCPRYHADQ